MTNAIREWLSSLHRLSPVLPVEAGSSLPASAVNEPVTVAALVSSERDVALLDRIARKSGWRLLIAQSRNQGREILKQYQTGVVIVDQRLLDPDWQQSFHSLFDTPQKFCVVLLSLDESDEFWEKAIQQGAYEVLTTPVKEAAIRDAVEFAWKLWRSCIVRAQEEL